MTCCAPSIPPDVSVPPVSETFFACLDCRVLLRIDDAVAVPVSRKAASVPWANRLGTLPPPERIAARTARDLRLDRGLRELLGGPALRPRDVLALDPGSTPPGAAMESRAHFPPRLHQTPAP